MRTMRMIGTAGVLYLRNVVSEVVFTGTCRKNIFYVHKKLFLRVGVKRGTTEQTIQSINN